MKANLRDVFEELFLNVKKNSFGDCKCYFLVLWMCNVGDVHLATFYKSHG